MINKIFIRADANKSIGHGHLSRALALSEMLADAFEVTLLTKSTFAKDQYKYPVVLLPEDLSLEAEAKQISEDFLSQETALVLDGYDFTVKYQEIIKKSGSHLVCIDDLAQEHFIADAIINHAGGVKAEDYSRESYTKLFLGMKYALLKPPFLKLLGTLQSKNFPKSREVFVCLGGADILGQTEKVVSAALSLEEFDKLHLVVGGSNKSFEGEKFSDRRLQIYQNISADQIIEILEKCSIAIAPASTLSLEVLATKTPLVMLETADNQRFIAKGIIEAGACYSLGNSERLSQSEITEALKLFLDTVDLQKMSKKQAEVFERSSANLVKEIFEQL